ncbi:MAG: hypothetical protein BWZ10_01936 [candidate division BRC1 bacterium ADurb.BinA364]|nr:MAG: hypothetical protein BWZ10_01936 [candidate division BRC1 bacterium ADurb.BinA364]
MSVVPAFADAAGCQDVGVVRDLAAVANRERQVPASVFLEKSRTVAPPARGHAAFARFSRARRIAVRRMVHHRRIAMIETNLKAARARIVHHRAQFVQRAVRRMKRIGVRRILPISDPQAQQGPAQSGMRTHVVHEAPHVVPRVSEGREIDMPGIAAVEIDQRRARQRLDIRIDGDFFAQRYGQTVRPGDPPVVFRNGAIIALRKNIVDHRARIAEPAARRQPARRAGRQPRKRRNRRFLVEQMLVVGIQQAADRGVVLRLEDANQSSAVLDGAKERHRQLVVGVNSHLRRAAFGPGAVVPGPEGHLRREIPGARDAGHDAALAAGNDGIAPIHIGAQGSEAAGIFQLDERQVGGMLQARNLDSQRPALAFERKADRDAGFDRGAQARGVQAAEQQLGRAFAFNGDVDRFRLT